MSFFGILGKRINNIKPSVKLYKQHFTTALVLQNGTFEEEGHSFIWFNSRRSTSPRAKIGVLAALGVLCLLLRDLSIRS